MKSEKSCGGIVFRKRKRKIEFLIIKDKKCGYWGFPKGHVEKRETEEETARREILEEVGLKIEFSNGFRKTISYVSPVNNVNRLVVLFLCLAVSSRVKNSFDEVEEHLWLEYSLAIKKLSYDDTRNLLKEAYAFLKENKL